MRQTTIIILVLSALIASCSDTPQGKLADRVLTNGQIFTVNDDQPWVEAVAIRDGEFVYVGDVAGAEAFISDGVEVHDLDGRMAIPGIVDAHTHPGLIELEQYDAGIEAYDRESFFEQLSQWAEENPGDDWVRVWCWPSQVFVDGDRGPDRADLDTIFPDRPVWITSCPWHSYWLNSKALETLGIDEDSEDPKFPIAMYKRDDDGRLTGWVKEGAGWQLFPDVFEVNESVHKEAVRAMLNSLSEHGVTTLYDAGNAEFADYIFSFIQSLDAAGELPVRYEATYMISTPAKAGRAIDEMQRYRETYAGGRLQFNTIKLFMDGVHENRSGALLEPYADDPESVSDTMLSVEELTDFLLDLHEAQFDLHVHVIGDLAVKSVLDAVEAAQLAVGEDFYPRVSMGHLQNIEPGDWARFGELGVSANFTPWWHGVDNPDPVGKGLGTARDNDTYRVQELINVGGNVTFSSDTWDLETLSPFLGMQVGHTRQYPREYLADGEDPDLIREPASEKLALEDLVRGYTINGAYQLRMEDRIGSIETGKSADLVVLPENIFEADKYTIHAIKPDAVLMEGKLIRGSL